MSDVTMPIAPHSDEALRALVAQLRDLTLGPHAFFEVVARGRTAIPAIEAVLRGPPESIHQSRCLAADALAAIAGREAVDALLRALDDCAHRVLDPVLASAEAVVVGRIAHHLGGLGGARAVEPLLRALEVRVSPGCVEALGRLGDRRALPIVVAALNHDVARDAAIDSVRALGAAATPYLQRLLLAPARAPGVAASSWIDGRVAAAHLLGELAGPAAELPLTWTLFDDEPRVRVAAAIALATRGAETAPITAPVLAGALDDDWRHADEAADALGRLGPAAFEILCGVIEGPSPVTAGRAVAALGRCDHERAPRRLAALVSVSDRALRFAAVLALEEIASPEASTALEAYASDRGPSVRRRALEALRRRGALRIDIALDRLGDRDPSVRAIVEGSLVELGSSALPALRHLATSGAPGRPLRVRWRAWRLGHRIATRGR